MTTSTTSEFIIGHSVDDASERRREARKIFWALLAALVIHLVVGSSIAAFHDFLFTSVAPAEEDKPMEMTIVDLPPPAATPPKNTMFMETDESKASIEPPKEKTFESNANSIAASALPAQGGMPLPTQEGKDRPDLEMENHNYSLPSQGAQPQPSAAPQETPQPSVAPQATPRQEEQLATLTNTPKPTPQPTVQRTPTQIQSRYQAMKQQTKISGAITNRGISSVNALGTPLGRYEKQFKDAIGSRWYAALEQHRDMAGIGTVAVHFVIDPSGRVKNVRVLQNTSNETFANVCLDAVLEAKLPPIPPELMDTLPPEGLEIEDLNFAIIP